MRCAKRAAELNPASAPSYNNRGNVLSDQGRSDEAGVKCEEAMEQDGEYAVAHRKLAVLLCDQREYDEATARLQKAIDLDPQYEAAYIALGNVHFEQKRYRDAASMYQKAAELGPTGAVPYNNWGRALRGQGRCDEAAVQNALPSSIPNMRFPTLTGTACLMAGRCMPRPAKKLARYKEPMTAR